MRIVQILCILCCLSAPALAREGRDPLGLRWGENLDELAGAGVTGEIEADDGLARLLVAKKVPKTPKDTAFARLVISRNYGLQRIIWVSNEFKNDVTGAQGLALYQSMKASLTEDYGQPRVVEEELGGTSHDQPTDFYKCLALDGCGSYTVVWRSVNTDARLRLVGTANGTGWLEVTYLGPDWEDCIAEMKKKK